MQVEKGMHQADHHHGPLAHMLCLVYQEKHLTTQWLTAHSKNMDLAGCPKVKGSPLLGAVGDGHLLAVIKGILHAEIQVGMGGEWRQLDPGLQVAQDPVFVFLCLPSPHFFSHLNIGIVPLPQLLGLAEVLVVAIVDSLALCIRQAVS